MADRGARGKRAPSFAVPGFEGKLFHPLAQADFFLKKDDIESPFFREDKVQRGRFQSIRRRLESRLVPVQNELRPVTLFFA